MTNSRDKTDYANCFYGRLPVVVGKLKKLSPVEKLVFMAVYSPIARGYLQVSAPVSVVSREVGMDPHNVRRTIRGLIEKGFLVRTTEKPYAELLPVMPEEVKQQIGSFDLGTQFVRQPTNDTKSAAYERGQGDPKKGQGDPSNSKHTYTLRSDPQISAPLSGVRVVSDPVSCTPTGPVARASDDDEGAPDGQKEPKPRGMKSSGSVLAATPSKRPELAEGAVHRSRSGGWRVLGLWARLHVQHLGVEDQDLVVRFGHDLQRWVVPIQAWIDTWMGGDVEKVLESVPLIFQRAKLLGYPIRLWAYFSPSRRGSLPDLIAGVARRELTPSQKNHIEATSYRNTEEERAYTAAKLERAGKMIDAMVKRMKK